MANDETRLSEILNQLKSGVFIAKQKFNGKKFSRRFFLDEDEDFISYEPSHKVFGKPRICKSEID